MNNMSLKPSESYYRKFKELRQYTLWIIAFLILSLALNLIMFIALYSRLQQDQYDRAYNNSPTQMAPTDTDVLWYTSEEVETLEVCSTSTFKSWMDYRYITSVSSDQYALQQLAETGEHGIRMYDGYMLVAMGNHYANNTIGKKFEIEFTGGDVLKVMVGDIKADQHTDDKNCISVHDKAIIEFIVDADVMNGDAKYHGDFNWLFTGSIKSIKEIE